MKKKNIFRESLWIIACLIVALIITLQLTGFTAGLTDTVDYNIHDTYYIFNVYDILIFVFAVIVSLVFAVRSIINLFSTFYLILIEILSFALNLRLLVPFYHIAGRFRDPLVVGNGGWKVYPRGVATGSFKPNEPDLTFVQMIVLSYCFFITATVLAAVAFLLYRSIKKRIVSHH